MASTAPLTFDGRVVVVTGAGRGLGRSHALAFAERGARVVVNDPGAGLDGRGSSAGPADEVVAEIAARGGEAVADRSDISTPEGAQALVDGAVGAFGRLDVLVNNAGILRDASLPKLGDDDVRRVIEVHLLGSIWTCRAAWPHLRESGHGRIVNTTSVAGYLGNFGQANYGAAKGGLIALTKVLAVEGARHGIRANAVAPGARTRMTEALLGDLVDRMDPALVSSAVVWLAHEECEASGEVFAVAAGRVARVFVAQSRGHFSPTLTPEEVRDNWDRVMDVADPVMPATVADELALLREHLQSVRG
ncbi:MAG TPA: SDR family NAD(P)-dependent oxidoreductase [Acidimicrobiales bacterium]